MAFNWKTFGTRASTALVFVVVMMAGLLWNEFSFFLLFSFVHFGCWTEYQRLIKKIEPRYQLVNAFHRYGIQIAGWCFMLYFSNIDMAGGMVSLHAIGWWLGLLLLFLLPITELLFAKSIELINIRYSFVGLLYISVSWALLVHLRSHPVYGLVIPLGTIFAIWINDTMAYLVGSMIGKTPLTPISPKKTWEGTIGGILLSIVSIALLAYAVELPVLHAALLAAIAAVTGTFGDLLESKLKRLAGVKDSGQVLPGHGGFLDRFDSLLLAVPFVWLYVVLVISF